jgi:hypothetical protein
MRFVALVLCCFSLVVSGAPATARAQSSLEALLAKSRTSSGSPYLYHIVSRSRETDGGRNYEIVTETQGLKYRARRCIKTICTGFYFDGDRSYNSNFNDTALPIANVVDGVQLTLRAIASYAFTAPGFRAAGGTIVEREPVARAGKTYRQLAIAPRFGAQLDAIVDPATGIVAGVASDAQRIAFEFREERTVGGKVLLPFAIALNGNVFERFEDRRISPDPLEAPPGLVPKLSAALPVAFAARDRSGVKSVVPCTIGGRDVSCLLDTGNSGMSMSPELAERLGIAPQADAFEISGAGKSAAGILKAPPLTVGGATYPSANYVVLHDLHQAGYDVVLGADAFAHTKITLDYGARTATFAAPDVAEAPGDLAFENFIPVAPMELDGTALHLALDTGDDAAIGLSQTSSRAHSSELASVRLGNCEISGLQVSTTKRPAANADGYLGAGFFEHVSVTFDYAREAVTLSPRPGDAAARVTSAASP